MTSAPLCLRALALLLAASLAFTIQTSNGQPSAAPVESETIEASDVARLLELVGQRAVVRGVVRRVGIDDVSRIHFLNFSESRGGFVAVIFPQSLPAFGDPDLRATYENQLIKVSGRISLFKDQPQIVVSTPSDIEVLASEAGE